jgi:type II secretory ATPase GspE/PulE/Tfp pilus assembly ATPase PilB-like protein
MGRIPIYEIMVVTPAIARAIERGVPSTKLHEIALREGLVELATAGMEQVVAGKTTIEEVFYKISGQ